MFVGRDFPPFQDQAARLLGIELAELLDRGETIVAISSHLRTVKGDDLTPATHLPVAPTFSGSVVNQLVVFDDAAEALVGNGYALSWLATTSAGRVLGPWARFQIVQGFGVTGYTGGAVPASAQSIILRASPLFYMLPTLMGGYIGQDLPVANQAEKLAYGFDFAPALSPDEVINTATASLVLLSGTDAAVTADPMAYSSGPVAISRSTITQLIAWPAGSSLTGNVYGLYLTGNTSFAQSLTAWSRITMDRVA
jgi:hypothetical protein